MKIPRFNGRWRNTEEGLNYTWTPVPDKPGWWRFVSSPIVPPYFQHEDGSKWYLPEDFESDGGSVPKWIHWLFDPQEYLWAYLYHDAACQLKTRCLWVLPPGGDKQIKVTFKRSQADTALYYWLRCSHAAWIRCQSIYYAVRAWAIATGQWR